VPGSQVDWVRLMLGRPAVEHFPGWVHLRTSSLILLTSFIGFVYLRWTPLVPDLAAQVARANAVHTSGITAWWTGWFGGLSLPNYSVLVPPSMAVFGVRATGLAAVLFGSWATTLLVRDSRRPGLGALAFAAAQLADLLDGRVTFAAGFAFSAWALLALRSHRTVATVGLGLAAYFASPLAGLFLGVILVAVAGVQRPRRRVALAGALSLLAVGAGMALMFPGTGRMPFTVVDALPSAAGGLAVLVVCRIRLVRVSAAMVLLAYPILLISPGAVGDNITRLAWVCAAPVVIATATVPRPVIPLAAVALILWPLADLAGQLHSASNPSAQAAYYQPLEAQLHRQLDSAGPAAIGTRVEVVDTKNHWGSVYLPGLSLARGWDRQADVALNPLFYQTGVLTASNYRRWLDDLAVGWVAVPAAPLDYASIAEARLVGGGLGYLRLTWASPDWTVYRVLDSTPLVSGATVRNVDSTGVVLTAAPATVITVRVRWSPYLAAHDPATGLVVASCIADADGWVSLVLPKAETVTLSGQFNAGRRLSSPDPDCVADLLSS
jgi:hypothetical protein